MYVYHKCSHNIVYMHILTQPVNMYPPSSMGFYDVYGNVWEWLEDHVNGLPGFKTHYLYEDYSASYFDGKHTMMVVRLVSYIEIISEWK